MRGDQRKRSRNLPGLANNREEQKQSTLDASMIVNGRAVLHLWRAHGHMIAASPEYSTGGRERGFDLAAGRGFSQCHTQAASSAFSFFSFDLSAAAAEY